MEVDDMKDHYDFTNARPNPYAERMKKGYSIAIHYETPEGEEVPDNIDLDTIKSILKQPGLNSLHLYFNKNGNSVLTGND
jgi:hypothetical protein